MDKAEVSVLPESGNNKGLLASATESLAAANRLAELSGELQQSPFLKACRKEECAYTPVWLMRQAGRYMKEFRDIRSKVSFLELCKTSTLACQVTVHAQETLGVDAAIIFADILLPLEALGVGLDFVKGEGPVIARPFRSENDLLLLPDIEPAESLAYVLESIRLTRHALKPNIPLIGFAAAPYTLASYLIEGGSSRNYENTKTLMFRRPELWHALMRKLVALSIKYLNAQVEAGAQALQIFDSWVGSLSPACYSEYVLPYSKQLIAGLTSDVPVIHFGTGTSSILKLMNEAGADVMGLDWRVDLAASWDLLGDVAIQGNLDPCVLLADREFIKLKVNELLATTSARVGHIFNLGHGVLPPTDPDNVKYLVELVHAYKSN